jgi:hypothetical protein
VGGGEQRPEVSVCTNEDSMVVPSGLQNDLVRADRRPRARRCATSQPTTVSNSIIRGDRLLSSNSLMQRDEAEVAAL